MIWHLNSVHLNCHFEEPKLIDLTTLERVEALEDDMREFLSPFITPEVGVGLVNVEDAIDDIHREGTPSTYVSFLNDTFGAGRARPLSNIEIPKYSDVVSRRIKLFQAMVGLPAADQKIIRLHLKGEGDAAPLTGVYQHDRLARLAPLGEGELRQFIAGIKTRKYSQRALRRGAASPTITCNGDDFIHYEAPRCLNVREMARIQSFPDSFIFRGKRTTGGSRRRWEIPTQTQVGNAVPPILGRRIAMFIKRFL